jgi:hypothetical protein
LRIDKAVIVDRPSPPYSADGAAEKSEFFHLLDDFDRILVLGLKIVRGWTQTLAINRRTGAPRQSNKMLERGARLMDV